MKLDGLPLLEDKLVHGYRLINSKFPPIGLFDDVASPEEFELLYAVQALTNPRLRTQVGNLELIPKSEIPFGINGCSYATAPFTHINPEGSRFSAGDFGVLYIAQDTSTALAEVRYHQQQYWSKVADLRYERFIFRALACDFNQAAMRDASVMAMNSPIYDPEHYASAQALGSEAKRAGCPGIKYNSVRLPERLCWALLTPKCVTSIVQCAHYEMIWCDGILSVNCITTT